MDEKTSLLISLGAATAANCVPCFEHYFKKANSAGLTPAEILDAVEIANKVKSGAHLVIRNSIKNFMGHETVENPCAVSSSKGTCCG
jgi:hypothetical protein